MARFSQQMLRGLLNPSYQQELMNVGRAIGGAPGMLATRRREEKEKEEELARIDQLVTTSTQATASAQQGDVSSVTSKIDQLRQQMASAKTVEEKRMYAREIQALQKLIPGTQKVATNNKAQAIIRAEEALLDPALDPRAKAALEERIREMKKDPQAMVEYNKYKMNQWSTGKAQQEMEADAWLKANSSAIQQAVQDEDFDELDNIISNAGDFSRAAQTYATTVISSQKAMKQFEQNSMQNKISPDTSIEENLIRELPEELQKQFEPLLQSYKDVVEKGWTGEEWKTGQRVRAEQIQKRIQGLYSNTINQIATSEYFADRRSERDTQEMIRRFELQMEAPIDSADIRAEARILNPDKETITQQDLDDAEKRLRETRNRAITEQIFLLDPERKPEETTVSITEKINTARQNGINDSVIREKLREDGHTDEEINAAMGVDEDVSYMSPEHTSADRAYIERVRSKISPMGTYTNG